MGRLGKGAIGRKNGLGLATGGRARWAAGAVLALIAAPQSLTPANTEGFPRPP